MMMLHKFKHGVRFRNSDRELEVGVEWKISTLRRSAATETVLLFHQEHREWFN